MDPKVTDKEKQITSAEEPRHKADKDGVNKDSVHWRLTTAFVQEGSLFLQRKGVGYNP